MSYNKPPIPDPVMRGVRQRCGFGCVVCGLPLYEYHHMTKWTEKHGHQKNEITLLCDQHHREERNGLLSADQVRHHNENPINIQKKHSKEYLLHYEGGDKFGARIGNIDFRLNKIFDGATLIPICIDNEAVLYFLFEDNHLLLNYSFYDAKGKPVMIIRNNELVYSVEPWDIKFSGKTITIRFGNHDIALRMTFIPPNNIEIDRAKCLWNGLEINITSNMIFVVNMNAGVKGPGTLVSQIGIAFGDISPEVREAAALTFTVDDFTRFS